MRGERVKVGESRTLARKGVSEREHGEESVDSTLKKGRFCGQREGKGEREGKQEKPP